MHKVLLRTFLLGITPFLLMAQTAVEKQRDSRVAQLQRRGIDTIVHYENFFGGLLLPPRGKTDTACLAVEKRYLLWLDHHRAYIQRFDNCRRYKPVRINPYFINTFAKHAVRIKSEQIKGVEYDIPRFWFLKERAVLVSPHCGYIHFRSYIPHKAFDKEYLDFGLESKYIYGYLNKNYHHNHSTVTYKLQVLLEKHIAALWPNELSL